MKIPVGLAKNLLVGCFGKAKVILNDSKKVKALLDAAEKRFKEVPYFGDKMADLSLLLSMMYSYVRKEYTDISIKTLVTIVAGLIYFVSPIDFILDKIPLIGFLDDAAVMKICYDNVKPDIEKYKMWKDTYDAEYTEVKKGKKVATKSQKLIEQKNKRLGRGKKSNLQKTSVKKVSTKKNKK